MDNSIESDAARWRKLIQLIGTPANGGDCPVTFSWDDATMERYITIGYKHNRKSYYIEHGYFEDIMDSIPEDQIDLDTPLSSLRRSK